MTFEFAWPWLLAVLPVPVLSALMLPQARSSHERSLRFPFVSGLEAITGARDRGPSRVRLLIGVLAWILIVLAASRPQLIGDPVRLPLSGRDMLLAVDISGSMQTEDMLIGNRQVDRLTAVKAVAGDFITRREGDRIGLILFGEQAYLQAPLTFDRKTVRTLLNESAIGLAGKKTAIGDAIGLAVKRLRENSVQHRVLVLLTDGSNTAGKVEPLKAAELAATEGIRVYTIGVGADEQTVGSFFGLQRIRGTDLDERSLRAIADKSGGRYFRARDLAGLQQIYTLLDKIEPVSSEEETYRPVTELYSWPLAAALLLSVIIALSLLGLPRFVRSDSM